MSKSPTTDERWADRVSSVWGWRSIAEDMRDHAAECEAVIRSMMGTPHFHDMPDDVQELVTNLFGEEGA